jgi:hypothetical protein
LEKLTLSTVKGSVQRKLRWVENGVNRSVGALDCGAGHYFEFFIRSHLALNIFPFPVNTAKLLGDFYNNRRSALNCFPRFAYSFVFLILSQYCTTGPAIRTPPRGEAQQRKKKPQKLLIGTTNSPRFADRRGERSPLRL